MKSMGTSFRSLQVLAIAAALGAASLTVTAAHVNVTRTNQFDRWITNVIEVRMPANRFVNEYHTNYVQQFRTNLVYVYATNTLTRTVTNHLVFDVVRTNYVHTYQTNLKTLNLTNWATVLVMKTNWYTQLVTNAVTIDLPVGTAPAPPPAAIHEPRALAGNALALEASGGARRGVNNQVDVQLKVRWITGAPAPLLIQQWRIEREDGTILLFGQERDFKRALPAGKYRVEVKAQRDEKAPLFAALGNLAVSPGEVTLQQKPARR